jgi:predicted DNA-binding transcriptional regulator YafY
MRQELVKPRFLQDSYGNLRHMTRTERLYRIDQLLRSRRALGRRELLEALECSQATLTRDIEYLRSQLNAPIVFDGDLGAYRLEDSATGPAYALPGLWFNDTEISALLSIEHLLEAIQPGLLGPHIAPLRKRLESLLGKGRHAPDQIRRRILLMPANTRRSVLEHFTICAEATLSRHRLRLRHHDRHLDAINVREVSPQRLVRYKENWYLDTWCHTREAIRTFSVDALCGAEILDTPTHEVSDEELHAVLAVGYGIYAGRDVQWATLRFTPWQGRWTSAEIWHVDQRSHHDAEGRYVLDVPYSDDTELVMDILKYGPQVEVLAPAELRAKVAQRLREASEQYR